MFDNAQQPRTASTAITCFEMLKFCAANWLHRYYIQASLHLLLRSLAEASSQPGVETTRRLVSYLQTDAKFIGRKGSLGSGRNAGIYIETYISTRLITHPHGERAPAHPSGRPSSEHAFGKRIRKTPGRPRVHAFCGGVISGGFKYPLHNGGAGHKGPHGLYERTCSLPLCLAHAPSLPRYPASLPLPLDSPSSRAHLFLLLLPGVMPSALPGVK